LIRGLIRAEGRLGRSHLSNRLCEIWDWRQANRANSWWRRQAWNWRYGRRDKALRGSNA